MKIRIVEEVESIFEVNGNPTVEMAKEIAKTRLQQDSTLDMVERNRKLKLCEVVHEETSTR